MPRYVIHVGPHKTGSTYLQARFVGLRAQLAERGILHPPQWTEGYQVSHVVLVDRLRQRDPHLAEEFAALNAAAHAIILISAEDLSDASPDELAWLRRLIGEAPAEVVFYCRRWSDLLLSGWQELVKHGHIGTFAELFSATMMDPHASHLVNFALRLDRFAAAFGPAAIRLVSYDHLIDRKIDLFEHFTATFLDWRDPPAIAAEPLYVSLGPVETELVRALYTVAWARSGGRDPDLVLRYLQARQTLDTASLSAAMERDLHSLVLNEDAPALRQLHGHLFEAFGDRLVEPRSGQFLFAPKQAELPFVGQNYLLGDGVAATLGGIYDRLRGAGGGIVAPLRPGARLTGGSGKASGYALAPWEATWRPGAGPATAHFGTAQADPEPR